MQNAGMAALGLDWRYLACEVHPDDLRAAIEGAKAMHFIGVNLTVPHKLLALDMMDALDATAKTWGAVNTVRFEGKDEHGKWEALAEFPEPPRAIRSHGFNTDADAINRALREDLGLTLAGARILLLGMGGAGRTAALKLASEGAAALFLVNRTRSKAVAVAEEIQARFPAVTTSPDYPTGPVDLVLNATSLGLKPSDPFPFDETQFALERAGAVYDMIYRPAETRLLKLGRAAGCRASNGLGMLLHQGARALELWSGRKAPLDIMRRALEQNVYA